jgi:predicted membrane channel-forming protein YqfA (hemolysin III family)
VLSICVALVVVNEGNTWPYFVFMAAAVLAIIASLLWGIDETTKRRDKHDEIMRAISALTQEVRDAKQQKTQGHS